MKFPKKYAGKWVATKNEKVIDSESSLTKLRTKIRPKKKTDVRYALIPKGHMAG